MGEAFSLGCTYEQLVRWKTERNKTINKLIIFFKKKIKKKGREEKLANPVSLQL
jgi:hypothetical protein